MKKVNLIKSFRDLSAFKAKDLCTEDKPYYKQFLDVYEKKLLDDLVQEAIDSENRSRVSPVIQHFAEMNTDIPIPFEVNGSPVNRIRLDSESYYRHCETSFDGESWHYLNSHDELRLYMALEAAGYLDDLE